ncbi:MULTISPECIES: IclR family transcriptional regulator [Haloarcula]|uniref:Transcriptional regulator n=1 Tax=Haloarcula pellucida TaxID=1427151 RepID=A0A830GM07_9EURY|nr:MULTISPECIES: IclR family transcriptional regulator [Halomicroarcula]MBX0349724.1 IclR family transcriptional regulator [Halomicroarcula pellucida]MDS0279872.1 IclR family transcriptional regulator [Halomicroarcula sp. S1AR25-4]GGN94005.1 transcriptional regulator [Halomicroarcula pellucida]
MPTQDKKTISAVETTLDILSALGKLEPVSLSELATQLDIPTSTVFIHLNTLVERDYVVKESGEYRRSFRFLEVGGSVRHQLDVGRLLRNKVEELSRKTGEIAGAGIEENGQRVILYRSSGEKAAGDEIPIGNHTEMHWTSLGKVILANLPLERRTEIIEAHGLPKGTEETLTSRSDLETALERIRDQGYAIDDEEHLRGVRGIAVPIFDEDEEVMVSLGITGPRDRFTSRYMANLLEVLRYTKNEIEVRNQYYEYSTIDG